MKEYCVKSKNVQKIVVDVDNVLKAFVRVTKTGWDQTALLQHVKIIVQVFSMEIVS